MKSAYIDCTECGRDIIKVRALLDKVPGMLLNVGDPDHATLRSLLHGTAAVMNGHTVMGEDLLDQCDTLKTIVFLGTGASSYIDMAAAERRGIEVLTAQGYGDRTNAEHAFALILSASRNVARMDRNLRQGEWITRNGLELYGKRLGIIGAGKIGTELIRIADAFGMKVVTWNRRPIPSDLPCEQVELNELLETADVISLHLSLNDTTRGILGKQQLALLKRDAIIVNAARGALIDEAALIDALKNGRIRHAALDVFTQEPLPPGHPLLELENVTLTAHAAFSSHEAMVRLLTQGFDAMASVMKLISTAPR